MIRSAWLLSAALALFACRQPQDPDLFSGTVSFPVVKVGSLVGGRVARVAVEEGQAVKKGELLVAFDPVEWQSAADEARSLLEAARGRLRLLEAGTRPEKLAAARAEVARLALLHRVRLAGSRPEEIREAQERIATAGASAKEAVAALARARQLFESGTASRQQLDSAQARHDEALATVRALEQKLLLLKSGTRPEEVEAAQQSVLEAQARLAELEAGPRKEEIASARSDVEAAGARLRRAETRLEELVVRSPADAVVQGLELRVGDLVPSGSPVAVLLLQADPWVTVYVPEDRLARVQLGQPASLRVDGLARELSGRVTYVSRTAEFTPRNVQTPGERVTQVFAVKVTVREPPPELKDGLWADVRLAGPGS